MFSKLFRKIRSCNVFQKICKKKNELYSKIKSNKKDISLNDLQKNDWNFKIHSWEQKLHCVNMRRKIKRLGFEVRQVLGPYFPPRTHTHSKRHTDRRQWASNAQRSIWAAIDEQILIVASIFECASLSDCVTVKIHKKYAEIIICVCNLCTTVASNLLHVK